MPVHPRTVAITAAFVATACLATAIPLAAFGGDAPEPDALTAQQVELLDVREQVTAINEQAIQDAPVADGMRCEETLDVAGIGDTCVQPDGLLRVEQADGRSATIHGLDAPPVEAAAYAPSSVAAVNGASVASVECVPSTQQHYVLVYARPGDVASRYATIAPLLRTEAYKISAFIDGEARSVDPTAGRKLPMRCDDGSEPTVLQATLDGLTTGTATFGNIVDGLRAQGYQFNGDKGSNERYIVYYDSPSTTGAAGTGHVFTSDASVGAGNQNNKGGLYSIEYRFDLGNNVPHWDVLVHEVMHTMGAVVNAAPHATGAANVGGGGHCNDGQDIMCYNDFGPRSKYVDNVCPTKVLDCGRDDYFNPAPAAGSYLATHWNAAATYNAWLLAYAASTPLPGGTTSDPGLPVGDGSTRTIRDTQRPGMPGAVRVLQSRGRLRLSWSGSRDNVGIRSYEVRQLVSVRRNGRTTTTQRTVATTRTTIASLDVRKLRLRAGTQYRFVVIGKDTTGNASAGRSVNVRIAAAKRKASRR